MAAITVSYPPTGFSVVRKASAQATTGQTDWLALPESAKYALIYFNLTANAGTTPTTTLSVSAADPVALDDGSVVRIAEHGNLTAITGAAQYVLQIGPGVTGIADDVTIAAAADSYASLNAILPSILGITVLNDRTTGDETYTYNLSILLRS